jgi:hypothetical protein
MDRAMVAASRSKTLGPSGNARLQGQQAIDDGCESLGAEPRRSPAPARATHRRPRWAPSWGLPAVGAEWSVGGVL